MTGQMKRLGLMLIGFLLAGGVPLRASSLQTKLQEDFQNGQLTLAQKLAYQGYWIFAPDRLPARYQELSRRPAKCATEIVAEIRHNLNKLDSADRAFFRTIFLRPGLPDAYISPKGYFKLHYTTNGLNAVPRGDADGDAIPDWVEKAAQIFDRCYEFEIDTLGYPVPPVDNPNDPQIDVYLHNIGAYGFTSPDSIYSVAEHKACTSYIEVDNDFKGRGFATHGFDALKVTAAHELFHVIQLGMVLREQDFYFYEMSSVWMEDQAYDAINDYYANLPDFFNNPGLPLTTYNGAHEYGATVWLHFLSKRFGRDVVRQIWGEMPHANSLKSMSYVLASDGSDFATEFATFSVWNYFTGSRADTLQYYTEGEHFPELYISHVMPFTSDTSFSDSTTFLTSKYFNLIPQEPRTYSLKRRYDNASLWMAEAIVNKDNRSEPFVFHPNQAGSVGYVPALAGIVAISTNVQIPEKYDYNASLKKENIHRFTFEVVPGGGKTSYANAIEKIFPNPFRPAENHLLTVEFNLKKKAYLTFQVLTESGRRVFSFRLGRLSTGYHVRQILWSGTDTDQEPLSSGVYLAAISGEGVFMLGKFALVR